MEDIISIARQLGWCWCWSIHKTDDYIDLNELIIHKPKIFWIMGPNQSGRSSVANLLSEATNYELLKVSKLIKQHVEMDGYCSAIIKELMQAKQPIFDEIVVNIIKEAIHKTQVTANGYIIDGFPIDVKQAKLFEFEIYRPSIVVYTRSPDDQAKASNNEEENSMLKAATYDSLQYLYEMKTLVVVMNETPKIICEKLMKDLTDYWGYSFNNDDISGKNKRNDVLEDDIISDVFNNLLD